MRWLVTPETAGASPVGTAKNAVCPGGEGAVLKTVGSRGLAGPNPVHGAITGKCE